MNRTTVHTVFVLLLIFNWFAQCEPHTASVSYSETEYLVKENNKHKALWNQTKQYSKPVSRKIIMYQVVNWWISGLPGKWIIPITYPYIHMHTVRNRCIYMYTYLNQHNYTWQIYSNTCYVLIDAYHPQNCIHTWDVHITNLYIRNIICFHIQKYFV